MKKLLLGTLALVAGIAAPAAAADMRVRPAARPAAYTNWTGCYIGGGGGNSWGHSSGYTATPASTFGVLPGALAAPQVQVSQSFDMTGFTGGVYGGCQVQFGVWVVGAEGDWFANNKEGQAFAVGGPGTFFGPGGVLVPAGAIWSAKERWYATARGRVGYAVDKWLFYATGGAAWMKIDSAEFFVPIGVPFFGPLTTGNLQTDRRTGWTVGGGVEYMLPYNWMIRSEYLYIKIPSYTTFTPGVGGGTLLAFPGAPTNLSTDLNNHILRVGLSYKFF